MRGSSSCLLVSATLLLECVLELDHATARRAGKVGPEIIPKVHTSLITTNAHDDITGRKGKRDRKGNGKVNGNGTERGTGREVERDGKERDEKGYWCRRKQMS